MLMVHLMQKNNISGLIKATLLQQNIHAIQFIYAELQSWIIQSQPDNPNMQPSLISKEKP